MRRIFLHHSKGHYNAIAGSLAKSARQREERDEGGKNTSDLFLPCLEEKKNKVIKSYS